LERRKLGGGGRRTGKIYRFISCRVEAPVFLLKSISVQSQGYRDAAEPHQEYRCKMP
jgi:hypothetical protein